MGDYARHHQYTVDLNKPLKRHFCGVLLAGGDNDGDDFIFAVKRDGEAYKPDTLPLPEYFFLRSDGKTVVHYCDHMTKDGIVTVTLPRECYECEGRFALTVKLRNYPNVVTTVAMIDGFIRKASAGTVIHPETDEEESGNVSWATVPDYWQTHIDEQVNTVNQAIAAATGGRSAFLFYTDAHWTYNYQKSPKLLKYLCMNTPMKKVIFGGDVIEDETDLAYLDEWREDVSQLPWHHSVAGNHDDSIDDTWTLDTVYDFLLKPEATDDVVRGANLYYHIDVAGEKTRYLFLDTATKTGNILNDPAQEAWLKSTLLSTPAGWHIVAVSHIWASVNYDVNPPVATGISMGGQICLDMFDAYNARTGDFASCTGKVEFCIGGHAHVDADYVSTGGIPIILAETDSRNIRNGGSCTAGTITENSVNAIVADYASGVVKVIRIGRGNSRTVQLDGSGSEVVTDYDYVAPTGNFTNVIKTSTETDLVTPYNEGHGYKNDYRYSSSSMSETGATGWDITGLFPLKIGDTLRFHNVEFMDLDNTGGTNKRNAIWLFSSDLTKCTQTDHYTPDNLPADVWNAEYNDKGDIVKMTVPMSYGATYAYARVVAKNLTGASVITVNEEIVITG